MTFSSAVDPLEEAKAELKLRYVRARALRQPGHSIGFISQRLTRKLFKKNPKTPHILKLKMHWREIVGEEIAKYSFPEKLTGATSNRILTLKVVPAAAPIIQHQSEIILSRVKTSLGGTISRIKILQGPLNLYTRPKKRTTRKLSPDEIEKIATSVASIDDQKLRNALQRLGEAVLKDNS